MVFDQFQPLALCVLPQHADFRVLPSCHLNRFLFCSYLTHFWTVFLDFRHIGIPLFTFPSQYHMFLTSIHIFSDLPLLNYFLPSFINFSPCSACLSLVFWFYSYSYSVPFLFDFIQPHLTLHQEKALGYIDLYL